MVICFTLGAEILILVRVELIERRNNMAKEKTATNYNRGFGGGVYFLAFIGAVVYYIQHADNFVEGLLGVLKAIVWPSMVVYKVLEFFNM